MPSKGGHGESVLCTSPAITIRTVESQCDLFLELEYNSSASKDLASVVYFPLGRVEQTEVKELFYANRSFYEMVFSIETVFDSLLVKKCLHTYLV